MIPLGHTTVWTSTFERLNLMVCTIECHKLQAIKTYTFLQRSVSHREHIGRIPHYSLSTLRYSPSTRMERLVKCGQTILKKQSSFCSARALAGFLVEAHQSANRHIMVVRTITTHGPHKHHRHNQMQMWANNSVSVRRWTSANVREMLYAHF